MYNRSDWHVPKICRFCEATLIFERIRHDNVAPCVCPPTMNRAIFPQSVTLWLFCVFVVGLSPTTWGQQTLPPLTPVNVSNFAIPFEIGGSAHSIREVELFVSKDRGRNWQFVARQPVESGKFPFRADTDGEYWFAFRTITSTGDMGQARVECRVLINTGNPAVAPPSHAPTAHAPPPLPNDTGPIVPPRPERFRPETHPPRPQPPPQTQSPSQSQPMQQTHAEEPKSGEPARTPEPTTENEPRTSESATIERATVARPGEVLAPRFPGMAPNEPNKNREGDLLDELLSNMSPFMDVQPAVRSVLGNQIAADRSNVPPSVPSVLGAPSPPIDRPGNISYVGINVLPDTRPQVLVRWHTGLEQQWGGAQIDVLRSSTQEGPRTPIAINLRNTGEYWWYLSPEDLRPFYITVRIRSLHGGISENVTRDQIAIDPQQLPVLQSQRQ